MTTTVHIFKECVHFCCAVSTLATAEVLERFDKLSATSKIVFNQTPTKCYNLIAGQCPGCAAEPTDLLRSTIDIRCAVDDLEDLLNTSVAKYGTYGKLYHSIPFSGRARTAKMPAAALAHQQFAINSMPVHIDPFFKAIWTMQDKLQTAVKLLSADPETLSKDTKISAIAGVNLARSYYSESVSNMLKLGSAILAVKRSAGNCQDGVEEDTELPTRKLMLRSVIEERWHARVNAGCEIE